MKQFKLFTLFMALACATNVWAWSGDGSSSDPYQIASASDWNTLATNVNAGNSYSGKIFKLTANITVSEMVGTDANRFSGTFDGDGHTLTFNKGTADTHFSEAKCGPFRYINGATFKRLHVAGTIYTSNQNAGMVGHAKGNNYFQSCQCSLTINSSRDGDGTHGGFIANNNNGAKSYFTNCLFDGEFISTLTTNCGGFIGWTEGNQSSKAYFTNCLFAPSNISFSNTSGSKTFSRSRNTNDVSISNSYYKQTLGDAQGTNAGSMSNADLLAALGGMWEISGGKVIPIIHPLSLSLTGSGTVNAPYLITNTTDWNAFASYVNSGIDFNECYFKLTADITVSEMVGTDSRRFSGTFNGDGHTLTFDKGTSGSPVSEGYCAPFRYINSATFKRLHVAGTIYTSNQFAGMVGHAKGTNYFQSCHSSLTINSSRDGDGTHGGFIANNNQTSYFTNCLFDGSFISTLTHSWGGFAGWTGSGYAYFTNCLFAPASISISNTNSCKTFARYNSSNASYSNAYYKQTLGDAQGSDASSMSNEQLLTALGSGWQISGGKVVPIIQKQTFTGSGTAEAPYLITSTADWNKLAFNVTYCDEPHSGKYFRLTADIAITSMVGTDVCAFGGIFDGDGHVLHLNIKDVNNQGTAPFRYIQDATIQYVKTDGFLTGKTHCAGLVGFANGTNLIQGCEVAAEVYGGDGCTHHGGILGHGKNSNTTIKDCLFSGSLDGATNTTGVIYGWGDGDGHHTIINCLFSGECSGNTILLIPDRGTKTITNCYHSTAGPSDGTDASSMSRAELLAALGAGWGMRETHVVPERFAASVSPQVGAATIDLESDYVPTQIRNGSFGVRPWMSYRYSGTDYTSYYAASSVGNDNIIETSYPNGVNGGWNSTETKTLDRGLFEYMHYVYNDNISSYGGCVEMNSQNCAVLWQDLTTHSHDVIRWSLLHAARTGWGPDVQSMQVEVGSPEYSGANIVAATGINEAVDSKITTASKATYNPSGYSGTYAKGGDNLSKLSLNKNTAPDNNAWHQVRGIYLIPEGQTVTRFAFISTSIDADANKMSAGNYLDNLAFSTLIGNLSAVQLDNGDVVLRGYWGETDASKHLVVATNSKTNTSFDMTSVANENFKITIPAATMGEATSLSVYHEDYPDAGRSITITPSYKLSIGGTTPEAQDGWYLISSPIGTVSPSSVINMTDNSYDIFRFNQNPAQNDEGDYLEWENWEEPNSGFINHNHFNLEPGRGYLYANSADVMLNFVGTPYSGDGIVSLSYSEDNPDERMWGWNLIGNPFSVTATIGEKPFYIMNDDRTNLIVADNSNIAPMEGVFVQATEEGENVTFIPSGSKRGERNGNNIVINLTGNKGNVIDRAIVSFDEDHTLPKFQIRDNSTKLYITQNGKDYAIAFSYRIGELPLSFKAEETGRYTLSFSGENMTGVSLVDMIDNAIIDLSVNDTYSFIGTSTDRENRFKLVFSSNNDSNIDIFAYQSGNDIVVSGEGELQVFDVMGRMVINQRINGVQTINKPLQTGVYIFRLNEKVQKIVVR